MQGRKIKNVLASTLGNAKFGDLKLPFACVATDIETGEEVVIKKGLVREGLIASASIPVLFPPVEWQGRYLVDGSLVNPVPVSVVKEMGADFIIAVNVIPDTAKNHQANKEPNIFNVTLHTLHIASHRLVEYSLNGADVVIEPEVADIGQFDFHRFQESFLQGQAAAQASIPEIKQKLHL